MAAGQRNPRTGREIIGVVRDIPHNGVEKKRGNPFIYQIIKGGRPGGYTLFMRTTRPTGDAVSALREKLRVIDPGITLFDTGEMTGVIDGSYDNRRAVMLLLAALAGVALFLSALGIYGVPAYDVSQRTREIRVRGAIGASHAQITVMILKHGLWKAGIGVAFGLVAGSWSPGQCEACYAALRRPIPVSFVLIAVALLASYLPARRAARIDPIAALGDE